MLKNYEFSTIYSETKLKLFHKEKHILTKFSTKNIAFTTCTVR